MLLLSPTYTSNQKTLNIIISERERKYCYENTTKSQCCSVLLGKSVISKIRSFSHFFEIQECWFGVHNVWVRVKNIPKHVRADVAG